MSLLDSVGFGGVLGVPRSMFDSSSSRVMFSKLRAKYTASQV
jgi:hypothetical protein